MPETLEKRRARASKKQEATRSVESPVEETRRLRASRRGRARSQSHWEMNWAVSSKRSRSCMRPPEELE